MIVYEWIVEEVDEHDDIVDVHHVSSYTEALVSATRFLDPGWTTRIALVRDFISDPMKGVDNRSWAYVTEGRLPEFFEWAGGGPAAKVPSRYHDEVRG